MNSALAPPSPANAVGPICPGETQFARMPWVASSAAIVLVTAITPAFAALSPLRLRERDHCSRRCYGSNTPSLYDHHPSHSLIEQEHGGKVDVHRAIPIAVAVIQKRSPPRDPGVVHQDVYPSEFSSGLGDETSRWVGIRDVAGEAGTRPRHAEFGSRRFELI